MVFYKACFVNDVIDTYIPGTVTCDIREALKWFLRYNSKKRTNYDIKRSGIPCLIKFNYNIDKLENARLFQSKGIKEHEICDCWTSNSKIKAQINSPVKVEFVKEREYINYI
jgi:hypothetical protein